MIYSSLLMQNGFMHSILNQPMFTPSMKDFLKEINIPIRLSCLLPSGYPIVLSLWFIYEPRDDTLICASSEGSKLISYLRTNPKVGFEIASELPPYCGIRGYGTVTLHPDHELQLMKQLYMKYFTNQNSQLYRFLTSRPKQEIQIVIKPQKVFDWNFQKRMQDSNPRAIQRSCPS
ncbi:MAG: pyridoxamine 5'-phosphate oxidase family protein [Candidatus Heimdallarchaeota archaeon]|nr:pyridoxamine 5'-phosphate oxidase family protein [Candidatus Heimdallarchaeota archaeon]